MLSAGDSRSLTVILRKEFAAFMAITSKHSLLSCSSKSPWQIEIDLVLAMMPDVHLVKQGDERSAEHTDTLTGASSINALTTVSTSYTWRADRTRFC